MATFNKFIMKALIYISYSTINFSNSKLSELESSSIKNNKKMNITGLLSYCDNIFYQYIEGGNQVELLMKKIEKDERHSIKKILYFNELEERIFPNWNMKICDESRTVINEDILIRNLFSFVKDRRTNNKFIQSSFIQNLISLNNKIY